MSYKSFENSYLNLMGIFNSGETPVVTDIQAATNNGNGLLMGQAAINNLDKRFWIGMGKFQAPIEVSNVLILTISGQTPSTSVVYNAGTIIINTVDNKAWVGTGNASTEGSFISISPSAADNADIDGGEFSLDGGTF